MFGTGKATGSRVKPQAGLFRFLACLPNTSQHYMVLYRCPALDKALTAPKKKAKFAGRLARNTSLAIFLVPALSRRKARIAIK